MRPFQIEAWALRIADRATRGEHTEDSRVELKADWPKPAQAARQIAGHANSARGATILWIIGLDESRGVVGADYEELSNWLAQVSSSFDGVVPQFFDLNISTNDKTIVALLIETDRAPYVVKNGVFGQSGGGSVEREVPWREGRKTRSARREDLIRLLEPLINQPVFECLECRVTVDKRTGAHSADLYKWFVEMVFYATPGANKSVAIPFHRCALVLSSSNSWQFSEWEPIQLAPLRFMSYIGPERGFEGKVDSLTIASTSSEVILGGPGKLTLSTEAVFNPKLEFKAQRLRLQAKLDYVGGNAPIIVEHEIVPNPLPEGTSHFARWVLGSE